MCFTTFFRIQRKIYTPIPSQHSYYELEKLVQQLTYRRFLTPATPAWDDFIPWRDELGALNFIAFPILLMCTASYLLGLLVAPLVSCLFLLCCPLVQLGQTDCCLQCTSDYKGEHQQHVYYEIKLSAMAGYPIAYSSLDSITERVLSYLHAHGVTQEQVWVRDGFKFGEREPSTCASIPASALTAVDVAELQAEELQQMQPMGGQRQQMDIEVGEIGRHTGDRADLLHSQHSQQHAYRLSDAGPSP